MSTVFISYAHEDDDWRKQIESQLKVLVLDGQASLEIWSDKKLESGSDWRAAIEEKLEGAQIAILIVTQNFISSTFIRKEELPWLMMRKEHQGILILPVYFRPCFFNLVPELSRVQMVTAQGRALSEVPQHEQDNVLKDLVKEVSQYLGGPQRRSIQAATASDETVAPLAAGPAPSQDPLVTLEVNLRHRRGDEYQVGLRYTDSSRASDNRLLFYRAKFDLKGFANLHNEPKIYANELERRLFPDGASQPVLEAFQQGAAEKGGRLRVNLEANAWDLHGIYWETLPLLYQSPAVGIGRRPVFIRSASAAGEGWPSPAMQAWPQVMKAGLFHLGPTGSVQPADLLRNYATALAQHSWRCELPQEKDPQARLEDIDAQMLVLSVSFTSAGLKPAVLSQNSEGGPTALSVEEFARFIGDLPNRPQVVVLTAEEGAEGAGSAPPSEGTLSWFAAELITTGVCAVVTRQAWMAQPQWITYLCTFATELARTGNIEYAAASASSHLDLEHSWKPVVLSRLRAGKLWYKPQFLSDGTTAWGLLVDRAKEKLCVPIIGPLISQHVERSRRDISQKWADMYHYPGPAADRFELRKVAQYVATMNEQRVVRKQFMESVKSHLIERYGQSIQVQKDDPLENILKAVWSSVFSAMADDPYNLLAELDLPVYLTTNLNNYLSLAAAMRRQALSPSGGAEIAVGVRDRIFAETESIYGDEQDLDERRFTLNILSPLIYYLFGSLERKETLVLTEDDHFRFLLRFPGKWARLPGKVKSHISDSALLFLGFDLQGWEFRSVFRAFLEIAGSHVLRENTHVAVQIDVDDDTITDPDRTLNYLKRYFEQIGSKPYVFRGSAQEFLSELNRQKKADRP